MTPDYVAIGHIAEDLLPDGGYTPGGTVTFAALVARNLGLQSAILTAAPAFLTATPLLEAIPVVSKPTEQATIFENIYLPEGRRQFVRGVAPKISAADVPNGWRSAGIVHIGPIAQECDADLLDIFGDALIGVTPQGFMRCWDADSGLVGFTPWQNASYMLPRIGALVLSIEDLPPGEAGQTILHEFTRLCPVVACTKGVLGSTLYAGGTATEIPAYPAQQVDATGAGDVYATSFFIRYRQTGDPIEAAHYAAAAAACSVEQPGASGIPTPAQVADRLKSV
jgi:1D-myo-inositol 3-kinase